MSMKRIRFEQDLNSEKSLELSLFEMKMKRPETQSFERFIEKGEIKSSERWSQGFRNLVEISSLGGRVESVTLADLCVFEVVDLPSHLALLPPLWNKISNKQYWLQILTTKAFSLHINSETINCVLILFFPPTLWVYLVRFEQFQENNLTSLLFGKMSKMLKIKHTALENANIVAN